MTFFGARSPLARHRSRRAVSLRTSCWVTSRAAALWATGVYEARMLTAFVEEPGRVTPAQMDRWCRDFDNWAICAASFTPQPSSWRGACLPPTTRPGAGSTRTRSGT